MPQGKVVPIKPGFNDGDAAFPEFEMHSQEVPEALGDNNAPDDITGDSTQNDLTAE